MCIGRLLGCFATSFQFIYSFLCYSIPHFQVNELVNCFASFHTMDSLMLKELADWQGKMWGY